MFSSGKGSSGHRVVHVKIPGTSSRKIFPCFVIVIHCPGNPHIATSDFAARGIGGIAIGDFHCDERHTQITKSRV
jgi:hypothetical protein